MLQARVFDTLSAMMRTDVAFLTRLNEPPTCNGRQISDVECTTTLYEFEKEAELSMERLKRGENFPDTTAVAENYARMLALPEAFFDQSDCARVNRVKFAELDAPIAYRFSSTAMSVFYKSIGENSCTALFRI
jgi:hypothetical protein